MPLLHLPAYAPAYAALKQRARAVPVPDARCAARRETRGSALRQAWSGDASVCSPSPTTSSPHFVPSASARDMDACGDISTSPRMTAAISSHSERPSIRVFSQPVTLACRICLAPAFSAALPASCLSALPTLPTTTGLPTFLTALCQLPAFFILARARFGISGRQTRRGASISRRSSTTCLLCRLSSVCLHYSSMRSGFVKHGRHCCHACQGRRTDKKEEADLFISMDC